VTTRVAISAVVEVNPGMPASIRAGDGDRLVPFLPMSAVSEAGHASYGERRAIRELLKGYTYFERGDVLLAKITPCLENGKAALLEDLPDVLGFGSTEFHVLRPGPDVDARYLFHAVWNSAFRRAGASSFTGSAGQKRLPASFFDRYKVPLPPLAEQRRIAVMLEKADAVRRKRRESLRLLDAFLRSAFLELFGDPVRNEQRWETRTLSEIAEVDRGKFTPRPRNDPRYYGGAYPFIQTGDIARSRGVLQSWEQTLNERGTTVSRQFPAGSIALAIAANIADTAIVKFDFYCPDSVVGITPADATCSEYLETCLTFFKPLLAAHAPMTAQRNINLQVLRPLRIPLPPLALQARFRDSRRVLQGLVARAQDHCASLDALFDSLAHQAFRR
jgi:type I restriction enzyme S subunit